MLPRFRSGGGKLATRFCHLPRGAFHRPRRLRGSALCEVESDAAQLDEISGKAAHRAEHPVRLDAHAFAEVARTPHFLKRLPRRIERLSAAVEPSLGDFIETFECVRLSLDPEIGHPNGGTNHLFF